MHLFKLNRVVIIVAIVCRVMHDSEEQQTSFYSDIPCNVSTMATTTNVSSSEKLYCTTEVEGFCVFPFQYCGILQYSCLPFNGSTWCSTTDNYDRDKFWDYCDSCFLDFNECELDNNNCSIDAACTNTPGSYECECNNGYVGNGFNCSRKLHCLTVNDEVCVFPFLYEGVLRYSCIPLNESSWCALSDNYDDDEWWDYCNFCDVNECELKTDNCSVNAVCNNTIGSYVCNCNNGYVGDGINCTACPVK